MIDQNKNTQDSNIQQDEISHPEKEKKTMIPYAKNRTNMNQDEDQNRRLNKQYFQDRNSGSIQNH